MWDRPEELIGRSDVDKHIQEPPHKRGLEDSKKTGVWTATFTCNRTGRTDSFQCYDANKSLTLIIRVLLYYYYHLEGMLQ